MMVERLGKKVCRRCGLFYRRNDGRTACKVDDKILGPSKQCRRPDSFISLDEGKRRRQEKHLRNVEAKRTKRREALALEQEILRNGESVYPVKGSVAPVVAEPTVKPERVETPVTPERVETPVTPERVKPGRIQCAAKTARGKQCRKRATDGEFCFIHSSKNQTPHGVTSS